MGEIRGPDGVARTVEKESRVSVEDVIELFAEQHPNVVEIYSHTYTDGRVTFCIDSQGLSCGESSFGTDRTSAGRMVEEHGFDHELVNLEEATTEVHDTDANWYLGVEFKEK